jgi:hypothetical protein
MKKKVNQVSELVTQYIVDNTIEISEVLEIFHPFIVCKRTRLGHEFLLNTTDRFNCNLLAIFNFNIKRNDIKLKKLRGFNFEKKIIYHIVLVFEHKDDETKNYLIVQSNRDIGNSGSSFYRFLMNMKKLVPNCLIEIERILWQKV